MSELKTPKKTKSPGEGPEKLCRGRKNSSPKQPKIIAREPFSFKIKIWAYLGARIGIWNLSSGVNNMAREFFWIWTQYLIFGPSRNCFNAILEPGPKLLPEHLKNMARELFLGLDRIFGFS